MEEKKNNKVVKVIILIVIIIVCIGIGIGISYFFINKQNNQENSKSNEDVILNSQVGKLSEKRICAEGVNSSSPAHRIKQSFNLSRNWNS